MPYARRDKITWMQGHYYHLFNRGARRLTIFPEESSYRFVLKLVKQHCQQFSFAMIAYCLMPNHYHFLVRQESNVNAGQLPQRVFNVYAKAYNRRYERSGTIFEGRFGAVHVDNDRYLRYLCQYIHANPVKDGIVGQVEAWPFSNYLEWIGQRKGILVDHDFVEEYFQGPDQYRELLAQFICSKGYFDEPTASK